MQHAHDRVDLTILLIKEVIRAESLDQNLIWAFVFLIWRLRTKSVSRFLQQDFLRKCCNDPLGPPGLSECIWSRAVLQAKNEECQLICANVFGLEWSL